MLLTVPPDLPSQGIFCRKVVVDHRALVGVGLSFFAEDLKVQLCRPLRGLKKLLFCDS
jgi:hypothetical protein